MKLIFSAYFWYWYPKSVNILDYNEKCISFKNENETFEARKHSKSLNKYYALKYFPLFIFSLFMFSLTEILTFKPIHFIAPICVVIMQMFGQKQLIILSFILIFSLGLFFYIDIKEFPYFIKYLIFSYALSEMIMDLVSKRIWVVFLIKTKKDTTINEIVEEKEMVSFAMVIPHDKKKNENNKRSEHR
jgi:hypothetical protein